MVAHEFEEEVHETSVLLLPPLIVRNEMPMYVEMYVEDRVYNLPASSEMCVTSFPK